MTLTRQPRSTQPETIDAPDPSSFTHRQRMVIFSGLMLGMMLAASIRPSSPPHCPPSSATSAASTISRG